VQFNTYLGAGAHIAAGLVNRPAADLEQLTSLLESHEVHRSAMTTATAAELRRWGRRLRPVFGAPPAEQADLVDALVVAANCRPRLVSHDGLPHHLHYAPVGAPLTERVQALTATGLAHLIADGHGGRLGRCQRDGCLVVFVDTSRNGRRRFCTVRCANAVNVSRHRARQRPAAVSLRSARPAPSAARGYGR
jgi:predicted RNA-binding Zn ribbon-like protein